MSPEQIFSIANTVALLGWAMLIAGWRWNGVPFLLVVPCLALTFLFGPAGLLLYFAVRATRAKSFYDFDFNFLISSRRSAMRFSRPRSVGK